MFRKYFGEEKRKNNNGKKDKAEKGKKKEKPERHSDMIDKEVRLLFLSLSVYCVFLLSVCFSVYLSAHIPLSYFFFNLSLSFLSYKFMDQL